MYGRYSYERHSHLLGERRVRALAFKLGVLAFKLGRVDMEVKAPHSSITKLVRMPLIRAPPFILCIMLEIVDLMHCYKLRNILILRKNKKKKI